MGVAMLVRVWATLAPKASQGPIEFWFFVVSYIIHGYDMVMESTTYITPVSAYRLCRQCTSQFSEVHFAFRHFPRVRQSG